MILEIQSQVVVFISIIHELFFFGSLGLFNFCKQPAMACKKYISIFHKYLIFFLENIAKMHNPVVRCLEEGGFSHHHRHIVTATSTWQLLFLPGDFPASSRPRVKTH